MLKRKNLPKLDDSLFEVIKKPKMSKITGGNKISSTTSKVASSKGYVVTIDD